ncbi:MAG: hypothetical protein HQK59_02835 [Deltaproteobacteria bacterium]|nr:hypothetical protein [Deltaproteobacteria bacterium]
MKRFVIVLGWLGLVMVFTSASAEYRGPVMGMSDYERWRDYWGRDSYMNYKEHQRYNTEHKESGQIMTQQEYVSWSNQNPGVRMSYRDYLLYNLNMVLMEKSPWLVMSQGNTKKVVEFLAKHPDFTRMVLTGQEPATANPRVDEIYEYIKMLNAE